MSSPQDEQLSFQQLSFITTDLTLRQYISRIDNTVLFHIYLMLGAWAVVIPFSSVVAMTFRYKSFLCWGPLYLPLILCGLGASGYGVYLIYDFKKNDPNDTFGSGFESKESVTLREHMVSAHAWVGISTLSMALLVSFLSACTRRSGKDISAARRLQRGKMRFIVKSVGRFSIILGVGAIGTGFDSIMETYGINEWAQFTQTYVVIFLAIFLLVVAYVEYNVEYEESSILQNKSNRPGQKISTNTRINNLRQAISNYDLTSVTKKLRMSLGFSAAPTFPHNTAREQLAEEPAEEEHSAVVPVHTTNRKAFRQGGTTELPDENVTKSKRVSSTSRRLSALSSPPPYHSSNSSFGSLASSDRDNEPAEQYQEYQNTIERLAKITEAEEKERMDDILSSFKSMPGKRPPPTPPKKESLESTQSPPSL